MDYLRSVFDSKQIKFLISAGISLILAFVLLLIGVGVSSGIDEQHFCKRWGEEKEYAQVSAFFSEMADFDGDKSKELIYKVSEKLKQDSIGDVKTNERLWLYCYSANGKVSVTSANGSTKVKAVGIGGDFFLFHPMDMLTGTSFDGDASLKDLVVIDENTAWVLFGSNDVVGQAIEIGGVRHIITGVVKMPEDRMNKLAGNAEPTIFMSYDSLAINGEISYVNAFEAAMPNPITSYAVDVIKGVVPADETRYEVVENSGRYHWTKLIKNVKNFGIKGMNGKGIIYPYWESIARAYEDYLTPVAVFAVLFFLYPAVIIFLLLIRLWKKRTIHRENVKDFLERKVEKWREQRKKKGEEYEED